MDSGASRDSVHHTTLTLSAIRTLGATLDLQTVLNRAAEALALAANANSAIIYLLDPDQITLNQRGMFTHSELRREWFDGATMECVRRALAQRHFMRCETTGAAWAVPIALGDNAIGVAVLTEFPLNADVSSETMTLLEQTSQVCAAAIKNAQIYDDLTRRLDEGQSLQRVAAGVLQGRDLNEILNTVCSEARRLTGAAGSCVLMLQNDQTFHVECSNGLAPTDQARFPMAGSPVGLAIQRNVPMMTNDPAENSAGAYAGLPLKSVLVAPMSVKSKVIGALQVVNKTGGFSGDDVRIISLFAEHAAANIEYARLRFQAEHLAVIEERQRVARELHDSVTQSLYSVTLYANATELALAANKNAIAIDHLHELRETAQTAMLDMRRLIFELHPPILEKEGLVALLQARLAAVESRAGLMTDLRAADERRLAINVEQELYRIAQEALNNVEKHAHARRVNVWLRYMADEVQLEVSDDGTGFDQAHAVLSGGMGLRNIAERVERLGGSLVIDSQSGAGTRIVATVKP